MESEVEKRMKVIREIRCAIVYCFYAEDDFMAVSLQGQENICSNYAISKNWEVEKIFSDTGSIETSILDRNAAKNLLKYIGRNKVKNCILLIHSCRVFGDDRASALEFIHTLSRKNILFLSLEEKLHSLFSFEVQLHANNLMYKSIRRVFSLFAENINSPIRNFDTFKGSFIVIDDLRKLLNKCVTDNYVQIRPSAQMQKLWEYKANINVATETENCIKSFLTHINK